MLGILPFLTHVPAGCFPEANTFSVLSWVQSHCGWGIMSCEIRILLVVLRLMLFIFLLRLLLWFD